MNIIIVRHKLPDGAEVETLYAHLEAMSRTGGNVARGEQLGTMGGADGLYRCHLHFELRVSGCRNWGSPGSGYSTNSSGWIDPSHFIDSNRHF